MRWIRLLTAPLRFLLALALYPLRRRAQRRLLTKSGWAELWLEGEVVEVRPIERWVQDVIRRTLRRAQGPRVVLSRMRRFTAAFVDDRHAKGVLVRLGPLRAGWASADELRGLLLKIQRSGREVLVYLDPAAGNKEMLIASAATRILMPPSGGIAATGTAAPGLFLKETLEIFGVEVQTASAGEYKSAPDQFTRRQRSEFDREQTSAIVRTLDGALLSALVEGGRFDDETARALLEESPMVGRNAHARGFVHGLTYEEDLVEDVMTTANLDAPPKLVGAGTYVDAHALRSPFARKRKRVGIVEVHGAIVDQAPGLNTGQERMAVRQSVVDDLRAAGEDTSIGAVVLHVNSRGGSVTASEAIWAAVRRLDKDKPVIACFHDVAASGGYYVACGARAIIASPLTVTGSIGVFSMLPTWRALSERLRVGQDVIKDFPRADLYNPWTGLDADALEHAQREVGAMYDEFLAKVSEARRLSVESVDEVARGRVWMGAAARDKSLVDGLGGVPEAVHRAIQEAGGRFEPAPVLVRSLRSYPRPKPFQSGASRAGVLGEVSLHRGARAERLGPERGVLGELLGASPHAALLGELFGLAQTLRNPSRAVAWLPLDL